MDYDIFDLGNITLQSGKILPDAKLAYQTHGSLNATKTNAILVLTYYTGTHASYVPTIGPDHPLDPTRYFILVVNMFGNGVSSSPSNTPAPYNGSNFPNITLYDNVVCQHRLITEKFGIETLALVTGWSMGAMQAFHWGAIYPQQVERILPYCGAAKCAAHNWIFLDGVKAALQTDPVWNGGNYSEPPTAGLKAFGRIYAGWAYSQTFFREKLYQKLGFDTIEELLKFWEDDHTTWDANDLLAMLWSWQHADVSDNPIYAKDFYQALASIQAKAIVMPAATDLYFTPADSEIEVKRMPNAELRIMPTDWGHCSGGPGRNPVDTAFIDAAIADLLNR
ncbi:MAG: alpha/beta fold hydrolase [Cyanobacteria bacterium P01_A01_bin.123]